MNKKHKIPKKQSPTVKIETSFDGRVWHKHDTLRLGLLATPEYFGHYSWWMMIFSFLFNVLVVIIGLLSAMALVLIYIQS